MFNSYAFSAHLLVAGDLVAVRRIAGVESMENDNSYQGQVFRALSTFINTGKHPDGRARRVGASTKASTSKHQILPL